MAELRLVETKKWYMSTQVQVAVAGMFTGIGLALQTGEWTPLVITAFEALQLILRVYKTSQPIE